MSTNASDMLDPRPLRPHRYFEDVIQIQDKKMESLEKKGTPLSDDRKKRVKRCQDILMHGNSGGRSREFIMLPEDASLEDLEAAMGIDPNAEISDVGYWRATASHYDASHGGR